MKRTKLPLITAIHHHALDDGPGIRATVFMKGCSLSCPWCHNPETISAAPEISFSAEKCIACGDCEKACRQAAVSMKTAGRIDRSKCNACGDCAEVCPALALKKVGAYYAPEALAEELLRDRIFYETSRGGVTFSGGEPTLHMDYLSEVMKLLSQAGISIAIQTAGLFDLNEFAGKLLGHLDFVFYDLKFFDSRGHRRWTGKDNGLILSNFLELTRRTGAVIVPRVPLIPGITATKENLARIAEWIKTAGCDRYELLAYNSAGAAKRLPLGKTVPEVVRYLRREEKTEEQYRQIFAGSFSDGRHRDRKFTGASGVPAGKSGHQVFTQ